MITIYTDGSYDFKQKIGGWAAIIVDENGEETELSGNTKNVTSNRMELLAALQGLFTLSRPTKVQIVTDSKYVEESFNKGWLHKWVKESQFDRPHFELWRMLYNLDEIHDISMKWVKGHAGHTYNERCDKLATSEVKRVIEFKKINYYAVAIGRKVGIFSTWDECKEQTLKFKNAKFKKFDTHKGAEQFIERNRER